MEFRALLLRDPGAVCESAPGPGGRKLWRVRSCFARDAAAALQNLRSHYAELCRTFVECYAKRHARELVAAA